MGGAERLVLRSTGAGLNGGQAVSHRWLCCRRWQLGPSSSAPTSASWGCWPRVPQAGSTDQPGLWRARPGPLGPSGSVPSGSRRLLLPQGSVVLGVHRREEQTLGIEMVTEGSDGEGQL